MFKFTQQLKQPLNTQNAAQLLPNKKQQQLRNHAKPIIADTQVYQKIQNLYLRKEQSYKQQIMKLIQQNENYKLKQKQLVIQINLLNSKLRQYLSKQQIQSYLNDPQDQNLKDKNIVSSNKKIDSLLEKYRTQIEILLQNYGYSKNEGKINHLKTQSEIIEFLLNKFKQKADDLKNYQISMRGKLSQQQQQTLKIKETINIINETNQLYKKKQMNYKQKLEQIKRQWGLSCQKLSKRQLELEKVEKQLDFLRRKSLEKQNQSQKIQSQLKQQNYHLKQQLLHTKIKMNQLMNINSQNKAKYHHLFIQYQQIKSNYQQIQLKFKITLQQNQRIQREVIRWKQRYQWLEKQRYENLNKHTPQRQKINHQRKWDVLNLMKDQKTQNQYHSAHNGDSFNKYILTYPTQEYLNIQQQRTLNLDNRVKKMEQQLMGENLGVSISDNTNQYDKQGMKVFNKKV